MDPETGLALLGPAVLIHKLLGPTADYVGEGLKDWTARRVANVQRVFGNAAAKLGEEELGRPGTVPPRVLKAVLEEAQFRDDELGAEYLGGVLASSRTDEGRDDRGATLALLVSRLSTYQLRAHYVLYAGAQARAAEGLAPRDWEFFFPNDAFVESLDLSETERNDHLSALFTHSVAGLAREDLVDVAPYYGSAEHLTEAYTYMPRDGSALTRLQFPAGGIVFRTAALGIELFTTAHGFRGEPIVEMRRPTADFALPIEIASLDGCRPVGELPRHPDDA